MLFNSVEFLFFFLPITLFCFFLVQRFVGSAASLATLVFFSLFFYTWWNPVYLLLLLGSMVFNFFLGKKLTSRNQKTARVLLTFGITANLLLLGYYKYTNFLIDSVNTLSAATFDVEAILLPLAISFFTFQQIAYLVDSFKGITKEYNFLHYSLFVSFFPQLIAGPIVHHNEMLPQFEQKHAARFDINNLMIGLSIFSIGLFKKTVLADNLAIYANPVFAQADSGQSVDFFLAWIGTLCYTLQLYFDFSGYSDMAIGLARMFNIVLPLNFFSPYKSDSIVEFWRRWHITLSRFLRDYLYIALGGNRKGAVRRYTNLVITMILGGIWHGAGWNFIIWGALHGVYLVVNHAWTASKKQITFLYLPKPLPWLITIIAVMIGWVFFRATTFEGAIVILQGMSGLSGASIPQGLLTRVGVLGELLQALGVSPASGGGLNFILSTVWIVFGGFVVLVFPNVYELFRNVSPAISSFSKHQSNNLIKFTWQPSKRWAIFSATLLLLGLMTLGQISDFLYFQF